jgi:ornithine cyclodeaminase
MRIISADDIDRVVDYPVIIDALDVAFRSKLTAPPRHHHTIEKSGGAPSTLLLMPAWSDFSDPQAGDARYIGVKLVTVSPDNGPRGLPSIMGLYLLSDGETGQPLALIDGPRLTTLRTAAASALAARYLARDDASTMLMIGSGALAPQLIRAQACVRPVRKVMIWNRSPAGAKALAAALDNDSFEAVDIVDDLPAAIGRADIVSCATLSHVPLVRAADVKPGTHVDLVGAFTPRMRESDSALMAGATVYCDTMAGGLGEAGDIVQAIAEDAITANDIKGDLFGLARGSAPRRIDASQITVFKSVGASIEDLAGAIAIWNRVLAQPST